MPTIVCLSTLHTAAGVQEVIAALYKALCVKYSPKRGDRLFDENNKKDIPWLKAQAPTVMPAVARYKKGAISEGEFLDLLCNIFSFMQDHEDFKGDVDKAQQKQAIARAWNQVIRIDDEPHKPRIEQIIQKAAQGRKIYLIANSSSLHIKQFLSLLQSEDASRYSFDINKCVNANKAEPVEILPNVYLVLSFHYRAFKEDGMLDCKRGKNRYSNSLKKLKDEYERFSCGP